MRTLTFSFVGWLGGEAVLALEVVVDVIDRDFVFG